MATIGKERVQAQLAYFKEAKKYPQIRDVSDHSEVYEKLARVANRLYGQSVLPQSKVEESQVAQSQAAVTSIVPILPKTQTQTSAKEHHKKENSF